MGTITIQLTEHEALVIFEFLARSSDSGEYRFVDPAEQTALWSLEGALEKEVPCLSPDYGALLQQARNALRPEDEG